MDSRTHAPRGALGLLVLTVCAASAAHAAAAGSSAAPGEEGLSGLVMTERMMLLAIQVAAILFIAKLGNILFDRLRLPGTLGELVAGIVIGPYLLGRFPLPALPSGLFPMHGDFPVSPELYGLCAVAAVVLLFTAGLETNLSLLLRYCVAGGIVGIGGVVVSFALGAAAVAVFSGPLLGRPVGWTAPEALFMGIVLTATSVGITARILSERRKLDSAEGVTILSAAVIDDIIGIILLAVVLGVGAAAKAGGGVHWGRIGLIAGKAVGVWLAATLLGLAASRRISVVLKWFGRRTTIAVLALGLALLLAGLFEEAGLAMIIGAYVMGLSLSRSDIGHMVREKLEPIYELLIPIFFCVMGMRIDLGVLGSPAILAFGAVYSVAAILAKLLGCGLPALLANFNLRGAARIGLGMAPRCEVALIIAGIGLSAHVLDARLFAAVIMMVLVNSVVAPAALAALYRSGAAGTRKAVAVRGAKRRTLLFEFPSPAMTEFLVGRLTDVFDAEGFFVHLVSHERHLYELRKDTATIELRVSGTTLTFHTDEANVPLINTAMYEAVAELEGAIRGLKAPVDAGAIATRMQDAVGATGQMLDLGQYLTPALVEPRLGATTKPGVIDELLELLRRNGRIANVDACRKVVLERERSLSTGLRHGVAIPHGRTDAVDRLVCAVGVRKEGVDFGAMDGQPSRIFILTVSPLGKPAPNVQFMATIAQVLNARGRRRVLECTTATEVYNILAAGPVADEAPPAPRFRLADYLTCDLVEPNLRGRNGEEVIDELLQRIERHGGLADVAAVREAVLTRQRQMSTGMEDGVAIPHARSDVVDRLACAVGVQHDGVDFGAMDGKPSRIFILVVTPTAGGDPYLQFAAAIIGVLDEAGRERVLAATTPQQLYDVLTERGTR